MVNWVELSNISMLFFFLIHWDSCIDAHKALSPKSIAVQLELSLARTAIMLLSCTPGHSVSKLKANLQLITSCIIRQNSTHKYLKGYKGALWACLWNDLSKSKYWTARQVSKLGYFFPPAPTSTCLEKKGFNLKKKFSIIWVNFPYYLYEEEMKNIDSCTKTI